MKLDKNSELKIIANKKMTMLAKIKQKRSKTLESFG